MQLDSLSMIAPAALAASVDSGAFDPAISSIRLGMIDGSSFWLSSDCYDITKSSTVLCNY